MRFGVRAAAGERRETARAVFLAGLKCNEETAAIKAGAQRIAAEFGLIW